MTPRLQAALLLAASVLLPGVARGEEAGAAVCAQAPAEPSRAAAHHWRCGSPRLALDAARAAIAADPSDAAAWGVLGDVHRARLKGRSARAAYETALEHDARNARSLWGLASTQGERAERRSTLVRYTEVAEEGGEPDERIDAARRQIELIDALGDTAVWQIETASLPGTLALRALARRPGEVSGFVAEIPAGRRTVRALVDSGASGLHLARRAAKRLGIAPLAEAELYGGGGDGTHRVSRGLVPRLSLGPVTWSDALASVAERSLHPNGAFTAIVGLDLFAGMRVVLDPGTPSLRIEAADSPEDDGDPLDGDPFAAHPGSRPILLVEGQLLVEGTVSGEGGDVARGLVLVDGGAARSLVSSWAAAVVGGWRDEQPRAARGYGGALPTRGVVRRAVVRAGGVEGDPADLTVLDVDRRTRLTGVRVAAIAGLDVLARTTMTLDLAAGHLAFADGTGPRAREP